MKTRTLMAALIIATLGTAGVAQANPGQGPGGPGGDGPQSQMQGGPGGSHRGPDNGGHGGPGSGGHENHDVGRGGPANWHQGDHVPDRYRGDSHWVQDWHSHDLPEPPHGHRWLEIDGDYVLAAVATGVITSIILGH